MARAITSGELAKLRAGKQASKLYLAIHNPAVVYTARVNQATFGDPIVQVTYDGGSGTLANVLPEMLMLVGSSAGAYDKGYARIRSAPSATEFHIGITSEIAFEEDDYLTIVDAMPIMPKNPALNGETLYMDYEIAYDDQNTDFNPIPIMGPYFSGFLSAGEIDYTPDASESYVIGSTITDYLWAAAGASATSDLDTATPTITFDTAGVYRVELTVTAANGKTTTAYRYVMIYDENNMPVTDFKLNKCEGSFDNGGWEFSAVIYEDIEDILPGALAILFSRDYYNQVEGSIGPVSGAEQIIAVGWIDEETIEYDSQLGTAEINVYGISSRLEKLISSPASFIQADSAGSWSEFSDMTLDMVLFNLLYWRSNVIQLNDVFLTGDTRRYPEIDLSINNIWSQLARAANERMQAYACADRYSRLFVEIPGQLLALADRSTIPVVMDIERQDWHKNVNIEIARKSTSLVEVAGITDDNPDVVLMSRAPGVVPMNKGKMESYSGLVFDNQDHANLLSGMLLAKSNNRYPHVDIDLASNNRFLDICPNQYCTISLEASDTPKQIVWTDQKIIPRRVSYDFMDGNILTGVEFEADTSGPEGVTVIPPQPIEENIDPGVDPGDFPIFPPGNIWFPPFIPGEPPENALCLERGNGAYSLQWDKNSITTSIIELENSSKAYYPCNIRDTGSFPTKLIIHGRFQKYYAATNSWELYNEADDWYTVEAIDINGTVIANSSSITQIAFDQRLVSFAVGGNLNIYGFRIRINTVGEGAGYSIGDEIVSGSVPADADDVIIYSGATIGSLYSIRSAGGPGVFSDEGYYHYIGSIDYGSGYKLIGGYIYHPGFLIGYLPANTSLLYAYPIGVYGRAFFYASSTTLKFRFGNDPIREGNTGTLEYSLSEASIESGYKINLLGAALYNICPVF